MSITEKHCSVKGCNKKHKARGYCTYHYDKSMGFSSPEYRLWQHIKQRCYNPKCTRSYNYMGRGITVCDEWVKSFDNFIKYIGKRPSVGYSLDRIDNDGNYEPGNVRWATAREQSCNTRHKNKLGSPGIRQYTTKCGVMYEAQIYYNGKKVHIGSYKNINEAIESRKTFERTVGISQSVV